MTRLSFFFSIVDIESFCVYLGQIVFGRTTDNIICCSLASRQDMLALGNRQALDGAVWGALIGKDFMLTPLLRLGISLNFSYKASAQIFRGCLIRGINIVFSNIQSYSLQSRRLNKSLAPTPSLAFLFFFSASRHRPRSPNQYVNNPCTSKYQLPHQTHITK